MDLVNVSHVALGAVLALDIADTLVNSGAAKSSHGCVMMCVCVINEKVDGWQPSKKNK